MKLHFTFMLVFQLAVCSANINKGTLEKKLRKLIADHKIQDEIKENVNGLYSQNQDDGDGDYDENDESLDADDDEELSSIADMVNDPWFTRQRNFATPHRYRAPIRQPRRNKQAPRYGSRRRSWWGKKDMKNQHK